MLSNYRIDLNFKTASKENKKIEEKSNTIEEVKVTLNKFNKIKIIVFSSPSCGPCKGYKEELKKLEKNKKFAEICEIDILDVDENADLARSHVVQNLPTTIVLDCAGNKLDFMVGSISERKLQQTINKLISSSG